MYKDSVHSMKMWVTQWCPTVCDPMDCRLPGSSVHRISQARILERFAISFSRASSRPRDQTHVSCIAGRFFNVWATSALFVHSIGCITISVLWIRKLKLRGVTWPFHVHPANKWWTWDWIPVESCLPCPPLYLPGEQLCLSPSLPFCSTLHNVWHRS